MKTLLEQTRPVVAMAPGIGTVTVKRAQCALDECDFYELRELTVVRHDEELVIRGETRSFYHKQVAQELIRTACPDVPIDNRIVVLPVRNSRNGRQVRRLAR